jgi:ubiquinone/menaquinone biosynthesis C-methylase UbiE
VSTRLARRLYYRLPPPARRLLRRDRRPPVELGERVAWFERADAPPLPVHSAYRGALKPRWRQAWRETRLLVALHRDGLLPPPLAWRAQELLASRTLPFAVAELRPELLALDLPERLAGLEILPTPAEVDAIARGYRNTAAAVLARVGGSPRRVIEIGAGSGYLSFALASAGVPEVIASDIAPEGYVDRHERDAVRAALGAEEVAIVGADTEALPFDDDSFDLVLSSSALEHVGDPAAALRECRRVLRAGGTAYHLVDAWFGPGGGHSLCGGDTPWGHARLTEDEFARYVGDFRPFEADDALRVWRTEFQRPRLTSAELAAAARVAGFEVTLELPRRHDHAALLTAEILADCRRLHPTVTRDDLLAASVVLLLRR